jgi:hypothetical protein
MESLPGRCRPAVVWPLRLAVRALGALQSALEEAWTFATYLLHIELWYEARPDDVFIVSYPKSGTTLLQMLLYQLTTQGEMEISHIAEVEPWFEMLLRFGDPSKIAALPSPRVFKSHCRHGMLPRGGRSIYLVRDLCDVALSAFHHQDIMGGGEEGLEGFIDRFIDGRPAFGSWYKHLASWWPHRNDPDVLFLRYEEVIRDLAGTARRVAAFCGLPLREDQLPRIVERCGVAFMKQHSQKFDPRFYPPLRAGDFIRVGQAGGGARELSAGQRERLARQLGALASGLGCPQDDPFAGLFHLPTPPPPAASPAP